MNECELAAVLACLPACLPVVACARRRAAEPKGRQSEGGGSGGGLSFAYRTCVVQCGQEDGWMPQPAVLTLDV
jgi:hypothetical protein